MKRKRKKVYSALKLVERIRREQELKETGGKLLSLRPGKVHESKKTYNRKKFNKEELRGDED